MSNVSQIYGTLRDSEPYIILNSMETEVSGNLSVLQNLDVCGNITFNNTDLSTALSNLVVDLTGGQDASFTNVDISNELNVLSSNGSTGTIRTQNYYVGSRNIVSATAQAKFTDLELKDSNTNVLNFLAFGSSGDLSMNGTLNVSTINHANGVNIEGVTIQNKNITMNGNLILNNIDVSGKLTQIDASLVALASGGGGGGGTTLNVLYDLEPNTTNSAAIINYIGENFKPYESWWLSEFTYTYSSGVAHGKGSLAFFGGVLAPNGKIIFIPYAQTTIGIYDPVTGIYSDGASHTEGGWVYFGGALAPNGKIIFGPMGTSNIGIYDPNTNIMSYSPHTAGANAFWGVVLAGNGKIIFVPRISPRVGIYDPITNIYTNGQDLHGGSNNAWRGGVLLPNGKIIFIPHTATNIGIYDPITDTYTTGPTHESGLGVFSGGVLAPNGKVILVPANSGNVGVYDPDDGPIGSYTGVSHGRGTNNNLWQGGVLAPDGKVIFVPNVFANVGIFDPITNTYIDGAAHGEVAGAFGGGVVAPDGKVIFVPTGSANIGIYGNPHPLKNENDILTPYFNKAI